MAITVTKPVVGGSQDTWGTIINTALDDIVAAVNGTAGTIAPDMTGFDINSVPVTASAAELNLNDGATAGSVINSKTVVYGASGEVAATTVDLGTWTVTESAGVLYFAVSGVNKMKLDASGNLTVVGDVTAFGTI